MAMVNITKIMIELGYKVTERGVCWGYMLARHQAVLTGRLKDFNERLERLATINLDWLKTYIQVVKSETNIFQKPQPKLKMHPIQPLYAMGENDEGMQHLYNMLAANKQKQKRRQEHLEFEAQLIKFDSGPNQEKQIMDDIFAFLGNVALYQEPQNNRSWLTSDDSAPLYQTESIATVAQIAASHELVARGNIQLLPGLGTDYLSNQYNITQLQDYFTNLRKKLQVLQLINPNDETLSREIVLTLGANMHSISLQYNPQLDEWTLAGLNLPIEGVAFRGEDSTKQLAKELMHSNILFNRENNPRGDSILMETFAFSTGDYAEIAIKSGRSDLLALLESLQFDMNDIYKNHSLSEAAQTGDEHLLKFLAKKQNLPLAIKQAIQANDDNLIRMLAPHINSEQFFNNDCRSIFDLAFSHRHQTMTGIIQILLHTKAQDFQLVEYKINVMHLWRKQLTDALIKHLKELPKQDGDEILSKIYTQQNALGVFLNMPRDFISYFFSTRKYKGEKVTKSIEALHLAFPDEKPRPGESTSRVVL
ncbi:Uncharacterised protein [Legionella busanensis]|uniref:Uncharacterized protein n=1 Tax=Legionella busanensis TaxID=190655 RepID=A0A378JPJ9_9GAMM|nr:hypothetical protein [Legionella busanensis]STX52119.1 Uncharacterised protein [Legionella busanensis]